MKIIKKHNRIITPSYGTEESAGLDIWLDPDTPSSDLVLYANESKMYASGLFVSVPKAHYAAILPRGGKGSKGLVVGNLEGVVDSDYRGELFICLWNRTDNVMKIPKDSAVVQMIIKPYKKVSIDVVERINDTNRGSGCLGHTDGKTNG